jgi:Pyruvate ferredoxin/flavodoxin oxidoreductase/Dihydroprymidine dehydrogenase domain II, 4Fe-4S cluster
MFQVRFHGRGGRGVVTAAELLAEAAFCEGRHAQAFPSFGSERTGAPVMSFCRIDDQPIRTHEPVTEPDALIIQDPTLLHQAERTGPGYEAAWRQIMDDNPFPAIMGRVCYRPCETACNRAQLDSAVGITRWSASSAMRRSGAVGKFPSTRRRRVSGCWW